MELSVRDWMIIVGALLIIAVMFDGFRRVRKERRGNIRMSLNKQFLNSGAGNEESLSELPSGRARAVERGSCSDTLSDDEICADNDLYLDHDAPMLMESIAANRPDIQSTESIDHSQTNDNAGEQPTEHIEQIEQTEQAYQTEREEQQKEQQKEQKVHTQQSSVDEQPPVYKKEYQEPVANQHHSSGQNSGNSRDAEKQVAAHTPDREMVVINVVAKDEYFKGPDLLHILLACDVRFGEMNIFHRHEKANGSGAVQFSVANSVEPGSFNLDTIDDFSTPGVCFFMSIPGPENAIEAFDCLVETAQCLVKNLNGELRDESRSVMTAQTLEHCRQRLFEFERRQLTRHG